ncbi:hypothetical protein V8B97DRAFT_1954362 [Scleroderma yunnanense]
MRFALFALIFAPLVASVPAISIVIEHNDVSPNVLVLGQNGQPYCVPNGDVCPHKYPCCSGYCDQYRDPPYCVPNGDVCPHKYPCCSGHCDQDRHVCTVSYHRAALIISIAVSRVLIPFDSNHRSSCPRCFYTIHRRRMSRTLAGSSL